MANERSGFYRKVLEQLLDDGLLRRELSVLVVAGGPADRDVFRSLGFDTWRKKAYRVVVLPLPVGPVLRIMPLGLAISC